MNAGRYLIVDPEIFQTGIRDKYEGFFDIEKLDIPTKIVIDFHSWLAKYHQHIQNQPELLSDIFHKLDVEGFEIMENIQNELGKEYKLEYFSDLQTRKIIRVKGLLKWI